MDPRLFGGLGKECDDDYLDWSDEDDTICTSRKHGISSDEEDFNFTVFPKSTKGKKKSKPADTDSEDEFEKEMASELSATMDFLTTSISKNSKGREGAGPSRAPTTGAKKAIQGDVKEEGSEFYDDIYFDSDDSEGEGPPSQPRKPSKSSEGRRGRRILSNDELFYDPNMDDMDQQWVDAKRRSYHPSGKRNRSGTGNSSAAQPLPQTDAVLNCPACLTTLCMDCQRHAIYHNQYRAMFVFNCSIDKTEGLKYPLKGEKKKEFFRNRKKNLAKPQLQTTPTPMEEEGGKPDTLERTGGLQNDEEESVKIQQKEGSTNEEAMGTGEMKEKGSTSSLKKVSFELDSGEIFHPVKCSVCNTKVAVYDKDEVYHFFNVVTSY